MEWDAPITSQRPQMPPRRYAFACKDIKSAEQCFDNALRTDAHCARAKLGKAAILFGRREYRKALELCVCRNPHPQLSERAAICARLKPQTRNGTNLGMRPLSRRIRVARHQYASASGSALSASASAHVRRRRSSARSVSMARARLSRLLSLCGEMRLTSHPERVASNIARASAADTIASAARML